MKKLLTKLNSIWKYRKPGLFFNRPTQVYLESSALNFVVYDKRTRELVVNFKHGGIYKYFAVQPVVFYKLLADESSGQYFVKNIRNNYQFTKLS